MADQVGVNVGTIGYVEFTTYLWMVFRTPGPSMKSTGPMLVFQGVSIPYLWFQGVLKLTGWDSTSLPL